MAKHLSVLRRFEVTTVQYDGWMLLEHHWRQCDWTGDVVDGSLAAIMRQATAHAKVCDGRPQPKPEPTPRPEGFRNSFVSDVWMQAILAQYARTVLVETPAAGTRVLPADADDALLMADPAHFALEHDRLMIFGPNVPRTDAPGA